MATITASKSSALPRSSLKLIKAYQDNALLFIVRLEILSNIFQVSNGLSGIFTDL